MKTTNIIKGRIGPLPQIPLYDGDVNVEFYGQRFEMRLPTAWIAHAMASSGFRTGVHCEPFDGCGTAINTPLFAHPVISIAIDELSGVHGMSLVNDALNSITPPWHDAFNPKTLQVAAIKSGHGRMRVADDAWSSFLSKVGHVDAVYECGSDESSWATIGTDHSAIIITDTAPVARMASYAGRVVIYVGGIDPFNEWWHPDTARQANILWVKTADTNRLTTVKFCNCNGVRECHVRALELDIPCANWSNQQSLSYSNISRTVHKARTLAHGVINNA